VKRQLGGPRSRWEEKIKIIVKKKRREGVDWIHLAEDKVQ
jgi:hypothetical protein